MGTKKNVVELKEILLGTIMAVSGFVMLSSIEYKELLNGNAIPPFLMGLGFLFFYILFLEIWYYHRTHISKKNIYRDIQEDRKKEYERISTKHPLFIISAIMVAGLLLINSFVLKKTVLLGIGFLGAYFFVLRPLFFYLKKEGGKTKLSFLVNMPFWMGLLLLVFGVALIHLRNDPRNGTAILIMGIILCLIGILVVYKSIFNQYVTYEFLDRKLIITLPGLFKKRKAIVPVEKIIRWKKITTLKGQEDAYNSTGNNAEQEDNAENKDERFVSYAQFMLGKADYPTILDAGNSFPKVHIVGTDFDFMISVKDPDDLIKKLRDEAGENKEKTERFI